MRSRSSLAMMEQIIMLLVFALAAALCLQAFVKSDQMSRSSEARDRASTLCQSAAEAVRYSGGDLEQAAELLGIPYGAYAQEEPAFSAHYYEDWTLSDTREYAYVLRVERMDSGVNGLGRAAVTMRSAAGQQPIFELEVCWQEDSEARDRAEDSEARDRAMTLCQTTAETLRHFGVAGGMANAQIKTAEKLGYHCDQGILYQEFDENWNPVEDGVYRLDSQGVPTDDPRLSAAHVWVCTGYHVGQEMEILFDLEVTWQEEVGAGG